MRIKGIVMIGRIGEGIDIEIIIVVMIGLKVDHDHEIEIEILYDIMLFVLYFMSS